MARAFNLDPNAAREASVGGKRIQETGKYVGTIVAAFYERNDRGTESMNLMFKTDSGQEAGPLSIYTHNGNGEALAGYKLVNALMTCCKVKSLSAKQMPVALYDYDSQAVVTKQKECYSELTGKRVGFVLQMEEYEKQRGNGGIGERLIVVAPFEAGTDLMAGEILDKKNQPEQLVSLMKFMEKNPVKKLKNKPASNGYQASQDFQAPPYSDDDIPWN
jgi:hypothetical protein